MIRYLRNQQIDKQLWDECIAQAPDGIVYAWSWYLDIICEGWDALVADNYVSVMPVTHGRKYLMDYIYPPFFAQQLGVFSRKTVTRELCISFLEALPSTYRFIEVNLHVSNKWTPGSFSSLPKTDLILDMEPGYEYIRKTYSENHSRNLKKAAQHSLQLNQHGDVQDVITMFRKHRGRYLPNLQKEDYEIFSRLTQEAMKRKMARVWVVNDRNALPVAGAVFFESHNTGTFIFSAVSKEGKTISAMHFLIDNYIRENCLRLKHLDFEGSNDPELARFYRGFGAADYVYLQIRKNQLPPPWKWFKN